MTPATDAGNIGPCQYPGCRDHTGNPRLTRETFCEPSQHHYRRLLDWIAIDFATLKTVMPTPARRSNSDGGKTGGKARSFGHPAEWASTTCADIASQLNWIEDGLRDAAGHQPPPHQWRPDTRLVAHAYRYLTTPAQFATLCTYDAAVDTAVELGELHQTIRRTLGMTRWVQRLPTPCPWCDTAALVRDVGSIECGECGRSIDEKHYGWLAGWIVDRLIEDYDTREAQRFAQGVSTV